jgi:hypothetical protein
MQMCIYISLNMGQMLEINSDQSTFKTDNCCLYLMSIRHWYAYYCCCFLQLFLYKRVSYRGPYQKDASHAYYLDSRIVRMMVLICSIGRIRTSFIGMLLLFRCCSSTRCRSTVVSRVPTSWSSISTSASSTSTASSAALAIMPMAIETSSSSTSTALENVATFSSCRNSNLLEI